MSLTIYIVIGVLFIAGVFIGYSVKQHFKFRRTRSEIILVYKARVKDWMEKVRQAETDEDLIRLSHQEPEIEVRGRRLRYRFQLYMEELVKPYEREVKDQARYLNLKRKIKGAKKRQKRQGGLQLYRASQTKQNVVDKLVALCNVLALPVQELTDLGLTPAQVRFQIMQTYIPLLRQARQGDRDAFLNLRAFFASEKEYHQRRPINGRPEDWAELVVRYLKNPDLTDFKDGSLRYNHQMPQPGELRLMAAEALRTESLVQGQEVLAHCNHYHTGGKYHKEVGDRLLAELAKLVDQLQIKALQKKEVLYG